MDVLGEILNTLWQILKLFGASSEEIAIITGLGTLIGFGIGIALTIILKLAYLNRVPKKVKKCFGVFVGIFLILGGIALGFVFGFKKGVNNAACSFVLGAENLVYEKITKATGKDIQATLDENFGITETEIELENEILELKENISNNIMENYGDIYKSVADALNTIQPFYKIFVEIYNDYGWLLDKVVGLDEIRQKPVVAVSIDLYNKIYSAVQQSYCNQDSVTPDVDFLECLSDIKKDIDYLKNTSIKDVIHGFVEKFILLLQNYINTFIDPIVFQVRAIVIVLIMAFLLPIIIRQTRMGMLALSVASALIWAWVAYEIWYVLAIFIALAIIPALIAKKKGRRFWAWYFYGIWLWLVAFIHSLCIKQVKVKDAEISNGAAETVPQLEDKEEKKEEKQMAGERYQCSKCGEQAAIQNGFDCPYGGKHTWDVIRPVIVKNRVVNNKFLWQCNICGMNPTGFVNNAPRQEFCSSHPHPQKGNSNLNHIWVFIGCPSEKKTDWRCRHCLKPPFAMNLSGPQIGTPAKRDNCPATKKRCVWEKI